MENSQFMATPGAGWTGVRCGTGALRLHEAKGTTEGDLEKQTAAAAELGKHTAQNAQNAQRKGESPNSQVFGPNDGCNILMLCSSEAKSTCGRSRGT